MRARRELLSGVGILLIICLALWGGSRFLFDEARLLRQAEQELSVGNYENVQTLCRRILVRKPESSQALQLAATAAENQGRPEFAVRFLQRISSDDRQANSDRWLHCGNLKLELGSLSAAERFFRLALEQDPSRISAIERLIFVLRIEGRNWEAQTLILELLKRDRLQPDNLYVLATTEWIWLDGRETQFLAYCRAQYPDEYLSLLAQARNLVLREDCPSALPLLQTIARKHPEVLEAQARLGYAILRVRGNSPGPEGIADWIRHLPSGAENDPEISFVCGLSCLESGDELGAIGYFGRTVSVAPNHREANYQLSQLLQRLGDAKVAAAFADRAARLARVDDLVRELQHTPSLIRELTELMESLGRPREAAGWLKVALNQNPSPAWAVAAAERLSSVLASDPPLVLPDALPGRMVDWSNYPIPKWDKLAVTSSDSSSPVDRTSGQHFSFVDEAESAGIQFMYDNGAAPSSGQAYMFEFSGGGVAALDFDGDGWPDLYLTQGGRWPSADTDVASIDRLYRNLGAGEFDDVTRSSGLGDERFSQGVTVGDYDNDGFADLYVANIGENRLFHNNGDGTFDDVTTTTGSAGDDWSLSAALADLNGDSLPDLYVVNYLSGPDVFQRVCLHNGRPVQCFPTSFAAAQDRLYVNLGDGTFRDATEQSGIAIPDGKGMGLVVADVDGSRRPSILVANDTTANFLFRNDTPVPGAVPQFLECGVLAGVAFNDSGLPQSSMGVAAGDANEDGLLDFVVTNYLREASNLYLQNIDHTFRDMSHAAGLRVPSLNMLKWGVQFLDADLDGRLDLVIANGHLDDYSDNAVPYKMPTQIFRNIGEGRFVELPGERLGSYFQRPVLGRAVARLDWNRDGREDFCVTHVDVPFALLTNRTKPAGHSLRLSFQGVVSSRDAIGATVRVRIGSRILERQLTAGDGFEARNEPQLIVGLGAAEEADSVDVIWPSGSKQNFRNLAADREWQIIENRPHPVERPR